MPIKFTRRAVLVNGALIVLLVGGGVAGYISLAGGSTASSSTTQTSTVRRGTLQASVSASGSVSSGRTRAVDFQTSGTVKKIYVKEGDKVGKGDLLAVLDQASAEETLKAAKASLTAAEKSYDNASDSSSTAAKAAKASAYSSLVQARNTYNSAVRTLDDTELTAPFSGTVTAVNGQVGGSSSGSSSGSSGGSGASSTASAAASSSGSSGSSSGFITLTDTKDLEISASFTEADTTKLRVGQAASVSFDALTGVTASGTVGEISASSTTSNNVVEYTVTIDLTKVPSQVRIGQTSTVSVTTGTAENALIVPSAAVRTAGGQSLVTVMRNGQQVPTPVTTGIKGDSGVEIKSGLREGDQVLLTSTGSGSGGFTIPGGGGLPGGGGGFPGGGGGGPR